jgi:hypothetical protein
MQLPSETLDTARDLGGRTWDVDGLFAHLRPTDLHLTPEERQHSEAILWHSVCTEFDARHFFQYLTDLPHPWSKDFVHFVGPWVRDERKHTAGFARLYAMLYEESLAAVYRRLHARPVNFAPLARFFTDELRICLLLAYDELVTTHVYHRSIAFYEHINKPVLGQWIRLLTSDEARHFGQLIQVLQRNHSARCQEAATILADILAVDQSVPAYGNTFVLDHDCPDFSLTEAELDRLGVQVILSKLHPHHH